MKANEAFEWIVLAQRKWGEGADHKKRDEAAALIEHCVNTHDQLVAALETLLAELPTAQAIRNSTRS